MLHLFSQVGTRERPDLPHARLLEEDLAHPRETIPLKTLGRADDDHDGAAERGWTFDDRGWNRCGFIDGAFAPLIFPF